LEDELAMARRMSGCEDFAWNQQLVIADPANGEHDVGTPTKDGRGDRMTHFSNERAFCAPR